MDKLIEKCLLKEEEYRAARDAGYKKFGKDMNKYTLARCIGNATQEALLTKAFPIIAGEIKKELEELGRSQFMIGVGDTVWNDYWNRWVSQSPSGVEERDYE